MMSRTRTLFVLLFCFALIAAFFILAPLQTNPETKIAADAGAQAAPPKPVATLESANISPPTDVKIPPAANVSPPAAVEKNESLEQVAPRKAVKQGETLFDALIKPLAAEAHNRREERRKSDPEYSKRIDEKLNIGRVNILLFGYGESHEPPATEKSIIGSHTIVSYNTITGKADVVSLTHDIRGPEIEQALAKRGFKSPAVRIDQAYNTGGFALQRKLFENATGLSIDFQITFRDVIIQSLIDQVFDGIDVDAPMAFRVHPFYLEGKKYPAGHFPKGAQKLGGTQVIQFIKTIPIAEGAYDTSLEHNRRKQIVFEGMLQAVTKRRAETGFWLRAATFLTKEMVTGAVVYDFDPVTLVVKNVNETTSAINKFLAMEKTGASSMPQFNSSIYVVDPAHGDGGVQWINANAAVNPITKRDLEAGTYPSPDMEVPLYANPYGDLITEYWPSVRELVKKALTTIRE